MEKLIKANEKYLKEYKEAYEESVKKVEQRIIKKHNLIFKNPDIIDIVKTFNDNSDITKLKPGFVPSFDYFFIDGDKFLGEIHIRISLTDKLLKYGGNIGYAINPKYWNMGYGTEILKLGLELSKKLIKEGKVLITCDDDNIGSFKIIEKNGGILENKVINTDCDETFLTRRYWINLK